MTDIKLLDTSIWMDYFLKENFKEIIDAEENFLLSTISLFEIKSKLLKKNVKKQEIEEKLSFIKKKSLIIPVTEDIAEGAAQISAESNLPAIDSIIYSTAKNNNSKLVTIDNDFRGLSEVIFPKGSV